MTFGRKKYEREEAKKGKIEKSRKKERLRKN
jgi:hypothetical protein